MMIRFLRQHTATVLFSISLVALLIAVALSVPVWLGPNATYRLAGPQENYYWGAAQFEVSVSKFEILLLRYGHGDETSTDALRDQYEIVLSKLAIIGTPSEATEMAMVSPYYQKSISEIHNAFTEIGKSMLHVENPSIALSIAANLDGIQEAASLMAQGIGDGELRHRDLVHQDFIKKRRAFFVGGGAAIALLLASLFALVFYLRQLKISNQRERDARVAEEAAVAEANRALKAKNAFLGAIGHELRTPLQTITAAVDNLSNLSLSAMQMSIIFQMEQAVGQMDAQMRDLSDYSRLGSQKLKVNLSVFHVGTLMHSIVAHAGGLAEKKGLVLRLDISSDGKNMYSDAGRVRQIVTNLVANAIKFSEMGEIVIRCYRPVALNKSVLCIEVEDHGRGIPRERLDDVFEPFVQIDEGHTREHDGMGMGLAIVKGLSDLLGAELSVRSEIGEGSTFSVSFPSPSFESESGAEDPVRPVREVGGALSLARVLVVDDQASVRIALLGILDYLGVKAEACQSAAAALELLNVRPYDVLLLDIQMPGTDGIALARALRSGGGLNAQVPIIAVSAYALDLLDGPDEALFNDYLMKPVRTEAMRTALDLVIKKDLQ
jgi:signal transduction histidine kinase